MRSKKKSSPPPLLFPGESELAPDTEGGGGFDREGMVGITVRGERGGGRPYSSPHVMRKITPSEDNYVTLSLNNRPQTVRTRRTLIDSLSESVYISRGRRAPQPLRAAGSPDCGCSEPKWTLRFFYARSLQEIPLLIHSILHSEVIK